MNAKDMLKGLLNALVRFVDTDDDGKIEISDIPGALAQAAAMQTRGVALVKAGDAVLDAIRSAASAGTLTSGGEPITAEQVAAAWERAKAANNLAADEARARLEARG